MQDYSIGVSRSSSCNYLNYFCFDISLTHDFNVISSFYYAVNSVQTYSERGWTYLDELQTFVESGGNDSDAFINAVSGIVNRGCADPVSLVFGGLKD